MERKILKLFIVFFLIWVGCNNERKTTHTYIWEITPPASGTLSFYKKYLPNTGFEPTTIARLTTPKKTIKNLWIYDVYVNQGTFISPFEFVGQIGQGTIRLYIDGRLIATKSGYAAKIHKRI